MGIPISVWAGICQYSKSGSPHTDMGFIPIWGPTDTAGFTIIPSFVALVHKKLYVGHYLSCRRFGEEPPRPPLTRPHLPSMSLHCRFITTLWVTPPTFGLVGINGGGENYLPFHQPHSGDFMPYTNHQQIWPVEISCGAVTPDVIAAASSTNHGRLPLRSVLSESTGGGE